MAGSKLRTDEEIAALYERHKHTVYRVCFSYMKNPADTEDAVQNTFFKLIKASPAFENAEHERAWLIRTASNVCKNELKHWCRKTEDIEDYAHLAGTTDVQTDDILQTVLSLPDRYKTAVYLYYYEGYTTPQIAEMLKKRPSTVRNHLREARLLLKERLGDDDLEEL